MLNHFCNMTVSLLLILDDNRHYLRHINLIEYILNNDSQYLNFNIVENITKQFVVIPFSSLEVNKK